MTFAASATLMQEAGKTPACDHASIDFGDRCQRLGSVARDHLDDLGDGAFLVAGVDAFRRIADKEVGFPFLARTPLEDGDTDLLGGARVHRRLVHDDGSLLQVLANGARGTDQRAEIGLMRIVDRSGHRDDHEISFSQGRWVGPHLEQGGGLEVFGAHLASRVEMLFVAGDLLGRQVDTDRPESLAEFNRQR
jgi:hypothetical protein